MSISISIEQVQNHEALGGNWIALDPEWPGRPTIIRLRVAPEEHRIELQNGTSFWQPLGECRWAERSTYRAIDVYGSEPEYWFMSWQEVSKLGGEINKCAAFSGHPFKRLKEIRERYERDDHRVLITPLCMYPLTGAEYKLAEESGVVPV